GDSGDLVGGHRAARVGHQGGVQRSFNDTGFGRRRQLRPREIDLQELVGNHEPAALADVEQMMTAGKPEILHGRRSPAMPMRSTLSSGCSSPSTSRKAKA